MTELAQLLHEAAGAPPPLDMAAVHRRAARLGLRGRLGWWLAALAAVVGIGVPTTTVLAPAGSPGGAAFRSRVANVEWWMVSTTAGAGTPATGLEGQGVLRFDGKGRFSGEACNRLSGEVDVRGGRLVFDDIQTTLVGCNNPGEEALLGVLTSSTRWRLEGDDLVLTAGGRELRLRRAEHVFPTTDLTVVAWSVDEDGEQWQAGYRSGGGGLFGG